MSRYTVTSSVLHYAALLALLIIATPAQAGGVLQELPATIDPGSKYLFFMHGKIVETKGVKLADSDEYGFYEYEKILNVLAKHGFVVISEARDESTKIKRYARKIKRQVNSLIENGVPPGNITVSGFSKGGKITLVSSSFIANKDVNYVVLAGCIRKTKKFINKFELDLKGRVLSMVDYNDDIFSSCGDMFDASSGDLERKEIILKEGTGHGVFYAPKDKWIKPMMEWIQ